jgi:hypothetical protein
MRHQTAWGFKNGKDNKLGFGYSIVLSPGYGLGVHLFVIAALAWIMGQRVMGWADQAVGNWNGVHLLFCLVGM